MSVIETWTCDVCSDPPESEEDFVHEDVARDRGWVRVERYVDCGDEVGHICDQCLNAAHERDLCAWLVGGRWTPCSPGDRDRLEQVVTLGRPA